MELPIKFTDVMVKGVFHSFSHTHEFVAYGEGTIWKPLVIKGIIKLFLKSSAKWVSFYIYRE